MSLAARTLTKGEELPKALLHAHTLRREHRLRRQTDRKGKQQAERKRSNSPSLTVSGPEGGCLAAVNLSLQE